MATPTLAVVAYVGRSRAELSALEHVLTLVSEFLDASVLYTLPRAASTGRVSLFQRVLARVLEASATDRHLLFHWLGLALIKAIEGGHLPIVKLIHEARSAPLAVASFQAAAASGHLDILQWLCEHRYDPLCIEEPPAQRGLRTMRCCMSFKCKGAAMMNGHLKVLRWLYESGCVDNLREVGDLAAAQGDLEMVRWLHSITTEGVFTTRAMEQAAKNGHLEVLQFLHNNRTEGASPNTLMRAMVSGHEEIVWFLKTQHVSSMIDPEALVLTAAEFGRLDLMEEFSAFLKDDVSRRNALEAAVANGHLHVAQWLGARWVSERALSGAAAQGHLSTLQWVHENGSGDWTPEVMAQAAMFGHLDVIQWFVDNKPRLLQAVVMDCAAATGHLEVVKWLDKKCGAPCTSEAMDAAAANGEVEVFHWLAKNRTEGCSMAAIQMAAQHGHLELVVWLHDQGYGGLTSSQMRPVPLDVAKWIHDTLQLPIDVSAAVRSVATGDMAYLRWIHENSTLRASPQIIEMVLPMAHTHMVEWMRANRPEEFLPEE